MKIAESFDDHYQVDSVSGCWNWQRGTNGVGYGKFYIGGNRRLKTFKEVLAHRFAYERSHGPIPHGMVVCHRCDNPACVNPDHLFLGAQKDNVHDMTSKGRARYIAHSKEDNGRAKLSELQVAQIRHEFRLGRTKAHLARVFGVSERQVKRITDGQQWRERAA